MTNDLKPLTAAMDNVMASRLGQIAVKAGADDGDLGDSIDRGLILRRLLEEDGFLLVFKRGRKRWHRAIRKY